MKKLLLFIFLKLNKLVCITFLLVCAFDVS
jgi:hypothetical protein